MNIEKIIKLNKYKFLKIIIKIFFILLILFYIISPVNKVFLFLIGKSTEAKIINLSLTKTGTYDIQKYTYEFTAENGLTYSGNFASNTEALIDSYEYGNIIEIQYYEHYPSINRICCPKYIIKENEVFLLTLGVIIIFILIFIRWMQGQKKNI